MREQSRVYPLSSKDRLKFNKLDGTVNKFGPKKMADVLAAGECPDESKAHGMRSFSRHQQIRVQ